MVPTSLLTDLVTIADVRYVFFRCAPDSTFQVECYGSRQPDDWPAPVVTPLSDEFEPAQYDYDAMTYGHAIELNGLIEDRLESVKRHSSQALSEVSLTCKMLQKRHDSDTALIHGSNRSYPGSTNTSPLDPMASVLGDDFDGANRRARDPPGPPVCLWSTDSWKRKYLEQLDQEGFYAQFDDLRRMRFKFLIIYGESCMGKTQFAKRAGSTCAVTTSTCTTSSSSTTSLTSTKNRAVQGAVSMRGDFRHHRSQPNQLARRASARVEEKDYHHPEHGDARVPAHDDQPVDPAQRHHMHAADTILMPECDNTAEGLSAAESGTWA